MNQEQRSQRSASADAFLDALEQFEEALQLSDSPSNKSQPPSANHSPSQPEKKKKTSFSLADLEEAVADIEQYFQSRQAESNQSKD